MTDNPQRRTVLKSGSSTGFFNFGRRGAAG